MSVPPKNDHEKEEHSNSPPTVPPPITPQVFNRLNAHIEQERLGIEPDQAKKYLAEIGKLVRAWRIKKGYTRLDLAKKLNLGVDQLLCIERRIGSPADITEAQLLTLQSLLATHKLDRQLNTLINDYLASRRP
jgi:ribosome-binding protein aMBF1 (putative translation factor)